MSTTAAQYTETDLGIRDINGEKLRVNRLTWATGGRSFEVFHVAPDGTETDLTADESYDDEPSPEQLADLLHRHKCERCEQVKTDEVDSDCGLCQGCEDYNAGRVVL